MSNAKRIEAWLRSILPDNANVKVWGHDELVERLAWLKAHGLTFDEDDKPPPETHH